MIRMDKLCYLARNKLAFGTGSSIMLLVFIPLNTEKRDMIFQFKFMEIPSIPIRKGFSFHSPSKFIFVNPTRGRRLMVLGVDGGISRV